jgi:putative transposase
MPRQPRIEIPGVPLHVVQRGNNRSACFFHDDDYLRYRQDLWAQSLAHGVSIHAYVLMTNHVHLLVTTPEKGAVSQFMQCLGRRYVGYINATYRRTGTLWEGRFKSCVVDSEQYVLRCYRYIELNPLRASMAAEPGAYRWSSYGANGLGRSDRLVKPHAQYLALGAQSEVRLEAYRAIVRECVSDDELAEIRCYLQQERALGHSRFQAEIQCALGRRVEMRRRGRPSKQGGK